MHAVNEDYRGMAGDFIKLGFLQPGRQSCPDCSIMPLAAFFVAHTHTYLFGCFFDSDDQSMRLKRVIEKIIPVTCKNMFV